LRARTAVTFRRGKDDIPHGLKFNTSKERKGANQKDDKSDSSESNESPSSDDSGEDDDPEPRKDNGKGQPADARAKKRSDSTSFSESSTSSSDSSSLSSSESSSESESSTSSSEDKAHDNPVRGKRRGRKSKSKRSGRKGKGRKKKKESKAERDERRALERQKIAPPSSYDGQPDLAAFDKWTYEVSHWARMNKFRDVTALGMLVRYTSGEAGKFFMDYIADNEEVWTLKTMFKALFDYCFPVDFKDRLRAKLSQSVQGNRRIRDFV